MNENHLVFIYFGDIFKAKNDMTYLFKYFFHPFKSGNVTSGHGIEVTCETGPVSAYVFKKLM